MKKYTIENDYNYKELREKALAHNATAKDRINLFNWLTYYDTHWNGESYSIEGLEIFPIYKEVEEDRFELVDCEIK